jgi:hypothetical protein
MSAFDDWYDSQPLVIIDRKTEHRLTWEAAMQQQAAEISRLKSELQDLHKRNYVTHSLFETGDADCPEQAKDRNGEVVLGVCKNCGRVEVELAEPCDHREEITRLKAVIAKCKDAVECALSHDLPYINKCKEALAAIEEIKHDTTD